MAWTLWLVGHGVMSIGFVTGAEFPAVLVEAMGVLDVVAVVYLAPNLLRQVSYSYLTTSIHYLEHGGSLKEEVMCWNRWYLLPMNLLIWNFSATHVLHHYVVKQAFYTRTLIAKEGLRAIAAEGGPFNDDTLNQRLNEWPPPGADPKPAM